MLSRKIENLSKLEIIKDEKYEQKAYLHELSMHDLRMNFSLRSCKFDCKMNYFNNPKFKAELWKCDSCEKCIDSRSHILYCPAYRKLREGKSLQSDSDLVNYLKKYCISEQN